MQTPVYDPEGKNKSQSGDALNVGKNPGEVHEDKMLSSKFGSGSSGGFSRKDIASKESGDIFNNSKNTDAFKSEKAGLGSLGSSASTSGDSPADTLGKGYTGGGKKKLAAERKKAKRRRTMAGWAIGLILATGTGSAGLGVVGGQFQFIHAAQLLQQLHFGDNENEGDSTMMKVARYIRYRDMPEKTRLGFLGNKFADRIEGQFNTSGLESAYSARLGYLDGYVLDKSKFKGGAFDEASGMSNKDVQKYFKQTYDVDVTTKDGKLYIDANQLKYRANLRFMDSVLTDAGARRVTRAVGIRVAATRGGVTFHPVKNLDKKILKTVDARLAKWNENIKDYISKGTNGAQIASDKKADEKDKAASQNADEADKAAKDLVDTANDKASLREKISSGLGPTAAAATAAAVLCIGHSIAVNFDQAQKSDIAQPLERIGGSMISLGNQVEDGGGSSSSQLAEQLGFFQQKRMYNPKDGTSWSDAKSIRAETGQTGGPDINDGAKFGNNPLAVLKNIPGIDSVCSVVNSAGSQVALFTVSFIGGPVSTVLQTVIGYVALPPLINALTDWLSNSQIVKNAAGALWGNYMNYGARLLSNDSETSTGGTPISKSETINRKQATGKLSMEEFQSHSLAYRLFDLNDRRSLAGSFLDKQKPNAVANVASLARGILNFGSTIASIPTNLFTNKVQAATVSYDYGFPKVQVPESILDDPKLQNAFENVCIVVGSTHAGCKESNHSGILQGDNGEEYAKRATKCFGDTITLDTGDISFGTSSPTQEDIKDPACQDNNEDWRRVRAYINFDQAMESYACRYGDHKACANVLFDGAST
ncbi:MAG TPA: hypothetical protein VJ843_05940 [Candidatus Saccharimonadales bacterium]|nr:hypothetical protein [Candidatus Saccharimonadales bacterium]